MKILGIVQRMLLMLNVSTVNSRSSAVARLVLISTHKNESLQTTLAYFVKSHALKNVRIEYKF